MQGRGHGTWKPILMVNELCAPYKVFHLQGLEVSVTAATPARARPTPLGNLSCIPGAAPFISGALPASPPTLWIGRGSHDRACQLIALFSSLHMSSAASCSSFSIAGSGKRRSSGGGGVGSCIASLGCTDYCLM